MPQKNRKSMFGPQMGNSLDLINNIMRDGDTQANEVGDPKTAEDIQQLINIFRTMAVKIKRIQK
jgi:hypothetical protein